MTTPRLFAAAFGVLILVALVYAPVAQHEFIGLDDRLMIAENTALEAGLSVEGISWALNGTLDGNWIPLTWISLLVDHELHGLSAGGTHVTNAVLHALASVLLLLALTRLTGAPAPSAFCAAIFAVHPLHVESVAWAIERKDVLSGAFFAATLLAYAYYVERPAPLRWAALLVLSSLGLLAKPMLVTVPCVLLLLDAWPLRRLASRAAVRRAVLEKLPLFALSFVIGVVTIRVQGSVGELNLGGLPLALRVANAVLAYATYLRRALWPDDLAIFYPHAGRDIDLQAVALAGLVLAIISALAAWQLRKRPVIGIGWLWFLGMLVPGIGLVQVGQQAMADRYMYLPLVGLTLPLAWGGAELARRGRGFRIAVLALALVCILGAGARARDQLRHWREGVALFEHTLAVTEANAIAYNLLGLELIERNRISEARAHLEQAVVLRPDFVDAHVNLGIALQRAGESRAALVELRRGLDLGSLRRAVVFAQLAAANLTLGRPEEALAISQEALASSPDRAELHLAAGSALVALQRYAEAEQVLLRAEALGESQAGLHGNLAIALHRQGRTRAAAERYRRAIALDPDEAMLANSLAWILATARGPKLRDPDEAVRLAEAAARLTSQRDANVLDTLAVAYSAAGRRADAQDASHRAARVARAEGNEALARSVEQRAASWRRSR